MAIYKRNFDHLTSVKRDEIEYLPYLKYKPYRSFLGIFHKKAGIYCDNFRIASFYDVFVKDDQVFSKARITFTFIDGVKHTKTFESDEEALKYEQMLINSKGWVEL